MTLVHTRWHVFSIYHASCLVGCEVEMWQRKGAFVAYTVAVRVRGGSGLWSASLPARQPPRLAPARPLSNRKFWGERNGRQENATMERDTPAELRPAPPARAISTPRRAAIADRISHHRGVIRLRYGSGASHVVEKRTPLWDDADRINIYYYVHILRLLPELFLLHTRARVCRRSP